MIPVLVVAGENLKNVVENNMSFENLFKIVKTADNSDIENKLDNALFSVNKKLFRTSLLTDKEKYKITKLIDSGQEINLDTIRNVVGEKRTKEIHGQVIELNKEERKQLREERRTELISHGKDKEPFILENGSVIIADVHGTGSPEKSEINCNLPESLERKIIQVDYIENTSSETQDIEQSEGESQLIRMSDSSGKINSNFLKETFKNNNKSSFIMTGGNLRGCFLESLNGVIREARKIESNKVDFHVPLDKCYDDEVYGKIAKFKNLPDAISQTISDNSEIYENGELIEAIGSKNEIDSKFRFYFWDNAKLMIDRMKLQLENKEEDENFNISLKDNFIEQKNKDEEELLTIRNNLKNLE